MEKILVILDGAADLPTPALDKKTPLEFAKTPNLDELTQKGKLGLLYPIDEKTVPGSDTSLISLFGNNSEECKRGIYEAVGAGLKIQKGDLVLRTNFATMKDPESREILDRRAGRTLTTKEAKILAKAINKEVKLPFPFEFKPTVQHRGVLVIRGKFSEEITNTDPEWKPGKSNKLTFAKPLDEKAQLSADIVNEFIEQSYYILEKNIVNIKRRQKGFFPANIILTRGAGTKIQKLKQYPDWMSINPMPLEIGISNLSGMKTYSFKYPKLKGMDVYENLYRALHKTIKFDLKILKRKHKKFKGCYIQLKETDLPGHDNKPFDKVKMIEIIDKEFFGPLKQFVEKNQIELVVTCDHSTPCKLKEHSADPVPVLVYGQDSDNSEKFCEKEAKKGALGKIYGKDFMKITKLKN